MILMKEYRHRIADKLLKRKLAGKGAVLLEGAKWCGKTTTAEQIAGSVLYMSETGKVEQNKQLARINPKQLLDGERPRLIDEWPGHIKNGLECDAVVHLRNGSYGLVEIKLGGDSLIEEGVLTLMELSSKIDTQKMKQPSFLMVLTAVGDYAYRREDGILIVPIGCLKD